MRSPQPVPAARRGARLALAGASALLALVAIGFAALSFALRDLEAHISAALGARSRVEAVEVGLAALEIRGVAMPGGADWPVPDSLRATRIRVVPSWRSLLGDELRVARVDVEGMQLAALRGRDGELRVVPTLLEPRAKSPAAEAAEPTASDRVRVSIGTIHGADGSVALYDASVARPPWPIRLTHVDATFRDVAAPALDRRIPVDVRALLDGPRRDGSVSVAGWIVPASRDLELAIELAGVDLLALRPYLVEANKARLEQGTFDLTMRAQVRDAILHAPGRLALYDLAFGSGGSASSRVLGVPRDLLLAGLRARGDRITLEFSLDGRVDDPTFSLDEAIATRVAVALANELGVSVGGLVEGTLGIGREALEGSSRAAGSLGTALERLLPRR
jgi:hypothetical protein